MSSLYLDHFGLNKPPFQITPDLGFFFAGGRRGDILSALLHVAHHEEGIITLVAEVGSGKTLLARLMLSKLAADVCTIYLANPSFSRDEILGAIARDLGLIDLPKSTEARLATLHNELLRRHALGQRVLLVIDEAHAMPIESLEEVRLLSNLETDQHKLLNIMLFGQPELDETLADRRMRQVRDRVVHRFQLTPLPAAEATAYVDHRLRAAGWSGGALFAPAAMALLIKASSGRARRINLLADKSLLGAYAAGKSTVQVEQVRNAVAELHEDIHVAQRRRLPIWAHALTVLTTILVAGVFATLLNRYGPVSLPLPQILDVKPVPAPPARAPVSAPPQAGVVVPPVSVSVSSTNTPALVPVSAPASPPVSPASQPTLKSVQAQCAATTLKLYLDRTEKLIQNPDVSGYSVQIAAVSRETNALAYLQAVCQAVEDERVYAQLSHYNGKDFIAVFVGWYPNNAKANAALAELPAALKANKPIVRTWVNIKQDQLP